MPSLALISHRCHDDTLMVAGFLVASDVESWTLWKVVKYMMTGIDNMTGWLVLVCWVGNMQHA